MVSLLLSLPQLSSITCMLFTLLALTTKATSFKIDEAAAAASITSSNGDDILDLFAWAKQHGAKIADSIEIKTTSYGGRGIFAKRRIPANTELVQIPYHLQLGVRQLAEGNDEEMQKMARSLPWDYIRENELFFLPLSIALVAERRKDIAINSSSIFGPFLQSLPQSCSNAVSALGTTKTKTTLLGTKEIDDDLRDLLHWAPNVANKVQRRRIGIQSLHEALAPTSVSIEELRWAATNVCSRSLVRKRIQQLTSDQVERIGEFAASDHSRMLPVIDLVNHGSLQSANVWVGHLSRGGDDGVVNNDASSGGNDDTNNDFSTSLKSTRDIEAGEELLFDYGGGGGEKINNERLLLDYGFVLPEHTNQVSIRLEEFDAAISDIDKDDLRVGMKNVPKKDLEGLDALITFLLKQASKAQDGTVLLFTAQGGGGEPSVQTLAVAVAMTCRGHDDVTRMLEVVNQISSSSSPQNYDASLLPSQIVESCTEMQKEFARYVLKRAAAMALVQRPSITDVVNDSCSDEEKSGFVNVARDYSTMCHEMLQEVSDMSR